MASKRAPTIPAPDVLDPDACMTPVVSTVLPAVLAPRAVAPAPEPHVAEDLDCPSCGANLQVSPKILAVQCPQCDDALEVVREPRDNPFSFRWRR